MIRKREQGLYQFLQDVSWEIPGSGTVKLMTVSGGGMGTNRIVIVALKIFITRIFFKLSEAGI